MSAGLLDGGTVWRAICRHVFDMGESEPDLVSLLLWASSEKGTMRYQKAGDDICASLRRRLIHNLGDAADSIFRFIESKSGPDALALAVVCQVVFGSGDDSTLDAAAVRLEHFHGGDSIAPAIGRTLGNKSVEAIADLDRLFPDDPRIAQEYLQRADQVLTDLRCKDYAYRSFLTRLSFEQRLERLGHAIKAAVDEWKKGSDPNCAKHPEGRSGNWGLTRGTWPE